MTIAARECAKLTFEHEHDRHDVALGVGLVAAKRASLIGRGPQLGDVRVAHGPSSACVERAARSTIN